MKIVPFSSVHVYYRRLRNLSPLSIVIFAVGLGCFYLQKKKFTDHCFAGCRSEVHICSLRAVPAPELVLFHLYRTDTQHLKKKKMNEFQHLKIYPTSLAIREMQIKTTLKGQRARACNPSILGGRGRWIT